MTKEELMLLHNGLTELENLMLFRKAGGYDTDSDLSAITEIQQTVERIVNEFH